MENYVVAYLLENNTYEIQFVVAEDGIKACSKVIPQFELLVTYVQKQYVYVDYDLLMAHKSMISLIDFDVILVPALNVQNNIKTQIISLYSTTDNTLRIIQRQDRTKRDALISVIAESMNGNNDYSYFNSISDIKQIILNYAHLTGIRVYTVDTLRALVKASLD